MLLEQGSYTALITPFDEGEVNTINSEGLNNLLNFQIESGITGIVVAGTTGESSTLSWEEHNYVVKTVSKKISDKCLCIAGAGSNCTHESLKAAEEAIKAGADGILLVDPYYNAPSSVEIRKEYLEPIASAFPDTPIIPYIIPSRTGTQLLPEDLALACSRHDNIYAVKEATNSAENTRRIRSLCGTKFIILSGDDSATYNMMKDPSVGASGVISVVSNIVPKAINQLVSFMNEKNYDEAHDLNTSLKPLFDLVTVTTRERTLYGEVEYKFRNPLPIKTIMSILGMPSGSCRRPHGLITESGFEKILRAITEVNFKNRELFKPIEDFFELDIDSKLKQARENMDKFCQKNI